MGFACELMRFLKWYVAIRRRVTENSLQQMLGEIEHMTNEQDRQLQEQIGGGDKDLSSKTAKEHTFCCGIFSYKEERKDRINLQ